MNKFLVTVLVAVFLPGSVFAADLDINGFLSAGGGIVLEDGRSYYGFDDSFGFSEDSKAGIQIGSQVTDKVSATVQITGLASNGWEPEIEWAYVGYEFNEHWKARAGRLVAPYFMVSDYLKVGYAYPWIRPPSDTYGQIGIPAVDGMDVIYSNNVGDWDFQAQAYSASYANELSLLGQDADMDLNGMYGFIATAGRDWLTLRASYHGAEMNIDIPALDELFGGIAMAGGGLVQAGTAMGFQPLVDAGLSVLTVSQDLAIEAKDANFAEVGFVIDTDDWWFVRGEWTSLDFPRSIMADSETSYVTGGIRRNAFTYHLTFEQFESTPEGGYSDPLVAASALLGSVDPTNAAIAGLDFLAASVAGVIGGPSERDTTTLGLRWDFAESTAFKLEYAQVSRGSSDDGVVSFVIDVIF